MQLREGLKVPPFVKKCTCCYAKTSGLLLVTFPALVPAKIKHIQNHTAGSITIEDTILTGSSCSGVDLDTPL